LNSRWPKEENPMSLNPQERAEFVNAYTRALITAWSSEDFSRRLVQDPKATLAEIGLNIPADAQVELVRAIPAEAGEANIDTQVTLWESGLSSGHYELHIPETPQIDMAELSEGDLDAVAAGLSVSCCSCTPCCSCT
jgi:hypothetical protein